MTALTILMMSLAYLAGSVSSAIIVCKLFSLPDPRMAGSGNPGATNVYRIGGKLPAVLVLVFDIAKGTVPVWGCYFLGFTPVELGLVAIAACLGHIYPLFFNFAGGKAVATAFGAMLPIGPELALLLIFCWATLVYLTGYSSIAAIGAVSLAPLVTWLIKPAYTLPVSMLAALIVFRHRHNLLRLVKKQEDKVYQR